jgi:PAS domain-containing protein
VQKAKSEMHEKEELAEAGRQHEIALNTAKAKAAYKAKLDGGDPEAAAARAEREFHSNAAQQILDDKKKEEERVQREEEMARLQVDQAERERQEEAEFEQAKLAALQAQKGRRGSVAEMQDYMVTHNRKSSTTKEAIAESIDSARAQMQAFSAKTAKLDNKIDNLNDDLEMQRKILQILAQIQAAMDRRKRMESMNPRARRIFSWASRVLTREYNESIKKRLHRLNYPAHLTCYTGVDWKIGRPFEEEVDALSQLTSSMSGGQAKVDAPGVASSAGSSSRSNSVLGNAGSSLLASSSSPRA